MTGLRGEEANGVQAMEHPASNGVVRPVAVSLRALDATYQEQGRRLDVLRDFSLEIAAGEFVAVIGPSGSGKSTLLDIVAGLTAADGGEVLLDGVALGASARLGRSAYMRQRDLLLPWRTVLANAALALEAQGMPKTRARERARARLSEFGLTGFDHSYPAQLSGGMRQRVAFLRTMLAGRGLLLLDEPFSALDALTRIAMQDWLLHRIAADPHTVLLVTHDVEEAIFLADRVVVVSSRPAHPLVIETIALERPRERELVTDPRFVAYKSRLLNAAGAFGGEVSAA